MTSYAMSSRQDTNSTLLSSSIDTYSYASSGGYPTNSTAMTTPDLSSPRKNGGKLEPMLEVYEGARPVLEPAETVRKVADTEVVRGPSVKSRASQFERFGQQSEASSSRLPSIPLGRTRSTSPLRIKHTADSSTSPLRPRRVPVPSTEPFRSTTHYAEQQTGSPPKKRSPPKLVRGSTKKMVQQWESLPSSPAPERPRLASTNYTRAQLDKPLPSPGAGPSSNPSTPSRNYPKSPSRSAYPVSPNQHLQTPRQASTSMPRSPSSWSLSPSGEKRKKGKSPLKEMLNVFGGGILRKGRGKGKENQKWKSEYDSSVSQGLERMGSNGLPGGIVFHDRMGDQEMSPRVNDPNIIRSSAIIFLIPTPCSSVSPWGSWLTSWGSLTSSHLNITYCPIFPDANAGHLTPKRVFSGTHLRRDSEPNFAFSAIPEPSANSSPDVEMTMKDCVEVRSLRREEVKGRGVPAVPQGQGTEVLEMVWQDGTKRYIGVEGVGGRLGWVSAIWDVLLACKSDGFQPLPPPSPIASPRLSAQHATSPLGITSDGINTPDFAFVPKERAPSGSTLKASRGSSSAPPVQKVGDRWVASSIIAPSSGMGSPKLPGEAPDTLRDSVQRMFDTGPDTPPPPVIEPLSQRRNSAITERIMAWQPVTERELSIFSRTGSKRSQGASPSLPRPEMSRMGSYPPAETTLSFDPNDLNPSRSASQVRRNPSTKQQQYDLPKTLGAVEEASMYDAGTTYPDPTHISHITFPKPSVRGLPLIPAPLGTKVGALERIPSADNSSCGTGEGSIPQTPASHQSETTSPSSFDHTLLAKLGDQSMEHHTISKQIDGVHVDLRQVILSLSALVTTCRGADGEPALPKGLDDKLNTIQLDVKAIENALNLSSLSTSRLVQAEASAEPPLVEVHQKLDAIAKLCEDVLARSGASESLIAMKQQKPQASTASGRRASGIDMDSEETKSAGDEVAQIMAELTGTTKQNSPRLGGLQVLHNISNPSSPRNSAPPSPALDAPLSDDTKKQVGEVLGLVTELRDARNLQTQQTTDIARYLNELNSWLEKFVMNSSTEIATMSKRLTAIVGSDPEVSPSDGEKTLGMPDLVADMHSMISEQQKRIAEEGTATQRLDSLLQMMGQERERMAGQQGLVEQVMGVLDRQRSDNEMLLRALATDLTAEIRGERLRFVEAMQQATTMNISTHVEEFKKTLSAEVGKAMKELGQLREERKTLEHQISDLFALKAKHGGRVSKGPPPQTPQAPPSPVPSFAPPSPGYGVRLLPPPPGR